MKTYKILYISLFTLIGLSSCTEDLLNPVPKDRLAKDLFWQTEQDAVYASTGVYALLGSQWRYCSMDTYTDMAHFVLQWRGESGIEKNTFESNNSVVLGDWQYYYQIIQASSSFLENVDPIDMNGELKNRLKGEMKTLRAFAYINLVMLYGDVPLVTTTLTVDEAKAFTQTSVSSIWNFITDELTAAAADLPLNYATSDYGRVTKGVALGLKAKAMLYAGNYQEAKTVAKAVMDLGVYAIHKSYAELFDYEGEQSSEIMFARIFEKNATATSNRHNIFQFFSVNSLFTQQCQSVPCKPLVDAYLMKSTGLPIDNPASGFNPRDPYNDRDPRLSHTIYVNGDELVNGAILNTIPGSGTGDDISSSAENVTPTGWYFKKWISAADFGNPARCGVDLIYLRYAEILLIYAEASIELGGANIDQSVLDAMNAIRERPDVNMPKVTTTDQSELREIVRRERMVELAMEGHRLYDIRRWRIAETVIPGTVKGMTYENAVGALVTVELSGYIKEFKANQHYLWPIPYRELTLNPNLKQNPNY